MKWRGLLKTSDVQRQSSEQIKIASAGKSIYIKTSKKQTMWDPADSGDLSIWFVRPFFKKGALGI